MSDEEWRAVVGWEGLYEVSSHGRVRSLDRNIGTRAPEVTRVLPGREMRPDYKNNKGRPRITLARGERSERTWVHRLVARAFIGEPPKGKTDVLHWDDNPRNNRVSNLRYGNDQDNKDDAVRNGVARRDLPNCPKGHSYIGGNLVRVERAVKRCRTCEYAKDRIRYAERLKEGIPESDDRHGTYSGYRAGCRCGGCKEANKTYKREYARAWRTSKRLSV